jgi:hypothetical protein
MKSKKHPSISKARLFATILVALPVLLLLSGCDPFKQFQEEADKTFGDQHLKTSVALIELHKLRYGSYPANLKDLKFTGEWDRIALQSVDYKAGDDRQSYYIEVKRGWVGKPELNMPEEFWQNTGYDRSLADE